MDKYKQQTRTFGIAATVAIWGVIGFVSLLRIGKAVATSQKLEMNALWLMLAACVTIAGALSGDRIRRTIGFLWLTVAVLGFLALIFGAGLDIQWMLDSSISLLLTGLITAQLIFMPDRE